MLEDGRFQVIGRVGSDVHGASCSCLVGKVAFVLAGTVSGLVRITVLKHLTVEGDVVQGSIGEPTVASEAGGLAIDELLLRELFVDSVSDGKNGFVTRSSGEGPARTAHALVLDGLHDTVIDPVP